ncbi:MAG TPA: succinyl-diaminopimelate desuccinylase [Acidimicrobiales bacterium]|nr:succinyl-diaminopimelate desuccinylase [Acidimicrobiales bacterium]
MTSEALLESTATLVGIASVSRDERAIADHVEGFLRANSHLEVVRIENNVVARTNFGRPTRVVLAGHLDTVPPAGNAAPVIDGSRLSGVGSADMKGGLAVMLALASELDSPKADCTYVFYVCEEVARSESGLLAIAAARAELLEGDVAIVLEPTNAIIEAGCQGVVRLRATVGGRQAHSARPWVGTNAIHRLGALLARVSEFEEREPTIDGVTYHESLQAVLVDGGVAGNVIPGSATVTLSHRFAPDRDLDEARDRIVEYLTPVIDHSMGDLIEVVDVARAARPNLSHPLLAALAEASGSPPVAKMAWTDVAFFFERGIPAANFGPGDPLVAHTEAEFVEGEEIERVAGALRALLS